MIKKLLTTTLFTALTGIAFSQSALIQQTNFTQVDPSEVSRNVSAISANQNGVSKTATVAAKDTLWYSYNKYAYLNGGVYAQPMPEAVAGTSIRSIGTLFKNSSTVTVDGAYFYAGRKSTSTSTAVTVNLQVYNCDAIGTPTGSAISSASAALTGTAIGLRLITFTAPPTVTGNFAVVINAPTDTIRYYMNDAATTSYGENLGLMAVASVTAPSVVTWMNYNQAFGAPYDFEPLISPLVSFSLTSNFSASIASPYCINDVVNYTNTSSSLATNPQFNLNQFAVRWKAYATATPSCSVPSADSVFIWNPGDGSPISNVKNYSHTFGTAGSFTGSLTVNYQCQSDYGPVKFTDTKTTSIVVSTCTGINELENSEFSIFPNPSNGMLTVKNVSINSNVELINVLGEVIHKEKMMNDSKTFDFTSLPAGNYYLKLTNPEGKSSVKKVQIH